MSSGRSVIWACKAWRLALQALAVDYQSLIAHFVLWRAVICVIIPQYKITIIKIYLRDWASHLWVSSYALSLLALTVGFITTFLVSLEWRCIQTSVKIFSNFLRNDNLFSYWYWECIVKYCTLQYFFCEKNALELCFELWKIKKITLSPSKGCYDVIVSEKMAVCVGRIHNLDNKYTMEKFHVGLEQDSHVIGITLNQVRHIGTLNDILFCWGGGGGGLLN